MQGLVSYVIFPVIRFFFMKSVFQNKTPANFGQGRGIYKLRIMSAPPSSEASVERNAAGDLACRYETDLQLRDSTGLSPVSPLCPPIRGNGHRHCLHSIDADYNQLG